MTYEEFTKEYAQFLKDEAAKSNPPSWFVYNLKSLLSKQITIEDWNQMQKYLRNNASDIETINEFLESVAKSIKQLLDMAVTKDLLNTDPSPDTIAIRDSSGQVHTAPPTGGSAAVPLHYLISKLLEKVDIVSTEERPGSIVYARDGQGNPTYPNLRSTIEYGGYNIVYRDGNGRAEIEDPISAKQIINKGAVETYVTEKLSTKADLVDGKVPASQLPSYVDDVEEYDTLADFPEVGEDSKIYVAKDTNTTYRWSGTGYVQLDSGITLGETSSTAYAGDKGKANRDDIDAIIDGNIKVYSAIHDQGGNDIAETYVTKAAVDTALDGKVDKVTSTSVFTRAYVVKEDGTQTTMMIDANASRNSIAIHNENGNLLTTIPTHPIHCANKEYVDDTFQTKLTEDSKITVGSIEVGSFAVVWTSTAASSQMYVVKWIKDNTTDVTLSQAKTVFNACDLTAGTNAVEAVVAAGTSVGIDTSSIRNRTVYQLLTYSTYSKEVVEYSSTSSSSGSILCGNSEMTSTTISTIYTNATTGTFEGIKATNGEFTKVNTDGLVVKRTNSDVVIINPSTISFYNSSGSMIQQLTPSHLNDYDRALSDVGIVYNPADMSVVSYITNNYTHYTIANENDFWNFLAMYTPTRIDLYNEEVQGEIDEFVYNRCYLTYNYNDDNTDELEYQHMIYASTPDASGKYMVVEIKRTVATDTVNITIKNCTVTPNEIIYNEETNTTEIGGNFYVDGYEDMHDLGNGFHYKQFVEDMVVAFFYNEENALDYYALGYLTNDDPKSFRGIAFEDGGDSFGYLSIDIDSHGQIQWSFQQAPIYSVEGDTISVGTPTANSHAANKKYVDDAIASASETVVEASITLTAEILVEAVNGYVEQSTYTTNIETGNLKNFITAQKGIIKLTIITPLGNLGMWLRPSLWLDSNNNSYNFEGSVYAETNLSAINAGENLNNLIVRCVAWDKHDYAKFRITIVPIF